MTEARKPQESGKEPDRPPAAPPSGVIDTGEIHRAPLLSEIRDLKAELAEARAEIKRADAAAEAVRLARDETESRLRRERDEAREETEGYVCDHRALVLADARIEQLTEALREVVDDYEDPDHQHRDWSATVLVKRIRALLDEPGGEEA